MLVIPEIKKLSQKGCHKFNVSLSYLMRHYLNKQKNLTQEISNQERKDSGGIQKGGEAFFLHILGSVPLEDHLDIVFTNILQTCNLRETWTSINESRLNCEEGEALLILRWCLYHKCFKVKVRRVGYGCNSIGRLLV